MPFIRTTVSIYDKPMYYTKPNQLFDIFTSIEKENLTLIKDVQELEQSIDIQKANLAAIKKKMEERIFKLQMTHDSHMHEMKQHDGILKSRENNYIHADSSKNSKLLEKLREQVNISCRFRQSIKI